MSIVATVEPDAVAPRVQIVTTGLDVYRVQGGVSTRVRGGVVGGVIYDYECPQETPVTYVTGAEVAGPVEMPDIGLWLIHPGTPELSRRVVLSAHDGWVTPAMSSSVDVPGGDTFAVSFPRSSDVGSLLVKLWTREDVDDFRALVADGGALFLSAPYDLGIGCGYVLLGDVSWARVGQRSGSQMRFVSFPFRFVRRPEVIASTSVTIDGLTGTIDSLTGTIDTLGS